MYAQVHAKREAAKGSTAYAHCTETDKCVELLLLEQSDKRLVTYGPDGNVRLTFNRRDTRKPYVANWRGMELTVLDGDID